MKTLFARFATAVTVLGLAFSSVASTSSKTFKISAIPDYDNAEMTRSFNSFADYLSKETGLNVEYVPVIDYPAVVTAFRRGEIDLVWFGGLTGVQARAKVKGAEAIAQRPQDEKFQSVFIKQKNLDNVQTLADVKQHSLAFGSENSTSGHLMPRYFLNEAGISPEADLDGSPVYSGSHDKTYALVEAGAVQVGAINKQYWEKMLKEGKVNLDKVTLFYTTPEYYDYNWTINKVDQKFGEGTKQKVTEALLKADQNSSAVMKLLSADKFIATNNENYQGIEKVAKALKLIR